MRCPSPELLTPNCFDKHFGSMSVIRYIVTYVSTVSNRFQSSAQLAVTMSAHPSSLRLARPPLLTRPRRVSLLRRAPEAAIGPIGGLVNYTGFGVATGGVIGAISAAYKMEKISAIATRGVIAQHAATFGAACGTYGFVLGIFDSAFGANKLQNKVVAASAAGAVANGARHPSARGGSARARACNRIKCGSDRSCRSPIPVSPPTLVRPMKGR